MHITLDKLLLFKNTNARKELIGYGKYKKGERMKRTLVFMLALVAMLTWSAAPNYASYAFAAEQYTQAEKATLVKNLKALPDSMKKEVADLVAPLGNAGPIVGIGIQFGLARGEDGKGVPVMINVIKGKPAEKAGFQKGDKVLAVNGKPFTTSDAFVAEIRGDGKAGRLVTLEIDRNGAKMTMATTTAVLRSDKTAEAKKMREAIEKESAAHMTAIKNAADAALKAAEAGSINSEEDPLLAALYKTLDDYIAWADKKTAEIDTLLQVN